MKSLFTVGVSLLLALRCFSQENCVAASMKVLAQGKIGKASSFSRPVRPEIDSLVLTYLGTVRARMGMRYKIVKSVWFWGMSRRATSRIVLFDMQNRYLGDYGLTMIDELPVGVAGNKLVFEYRVKHPTGSNRFSIDFSKGIPLTIFLFEACDYGTEYQFSKNLQSS